MILDAEIRLRPDEVDAELYRRIVADLSFVNPAWARAKARGSFLGDLEREIQGWREGWGYGGPELILPRGYAIRLFDHLEELGRPSAFENRMAEGSPLPCAFFAEARDYQDAAVEAFMTGPDQGTFLLPCGAGKTVLALRLVSRLQRSTLILVHTKDLLEQWRDRIRAFLGQKAGTIGAGKWKPAPVTVAMVQTLARRPRHDVAGLGQDFGLLIVDECFPAGTPVDGRPIESLQVGDEVSAYNHATGTVERRRVVHLFRSRPSALVRVWTRHGPVFTCTPGHGVYTQRGYVSAAKLRSGDTMLRREDDGEERDLRGMRGAGDEPPSEVLPVLSSDQEGEAPEGLRNAVHMVRRDGQGRGAEGARAGSQRPGLLQRRLQDEGSSAPGIRDDGAHEPEARLGTDDSEQPDAPAGDPPEGLRHPEADRAPAECPGGQRTRPDGNAGGAGGGPGLGDRGSSQDEAASGERLSDLLQAGHRQPGAEARNRGRRGDPSREGQGEGREEDRAPSFARVDRVEILQPGSDGRFGGLCPDGHVYNVEVEGLRNYYANGVLVHNCHHSPAKTYLDLLQVLACRWRVGLTATPKRDDGLTPIMQWAFGDPIFSIGHDELIERGFLMVPTVRRLSTRFAPRLDRLGEFYEKERRGDLAELRRQLDGRLTDEEKAAQLALASLLAAKPGGVLERAITAAFLDSPAGPIEEVEAFIANFDRFEVPVDEAEDWKARLVSAVAGIRRARKRTAKVEAEIEHLSRQLRRGYRWDGEGAYPDWGWDALSRRLVADADRNALLCSTVAELATRGSVLLLLTRKAHCYALEGLLAAAGTSARALTSKTPTKERAQTLADFSSGGFRVLVATQLADEGLDVPTLSAVVIGAPGKAEGRTIQRIGRVMRPAEGKKAAAVVHACDWGVELLARQAKTRETAFRKVLGRVDFDEHRPTTAATAPPSRRQATLW